MMPLVTLTEAEAIVPVRTLCHITDHSSLYVYSFNSSSVIQYLTPHNMVQLVVGGVYKLLYI